MAKVLTKIECLDGSHRGLAVDAKMMFDNGIPARCVGDALSRKYQVRVSKSAAERFRTKRWVPEREGTQKRLEASKAIWDLLGGNRGMDLLLFAQLFELLNTLKDVKQVVAVRDHVLKCRAHELKEDEFMFKTGQLKPGEASEDGEEDAAAEEAKTKRVMNKIRAIFGLSPLPDEASSEESDAVSQAMPEAVRPVHEGVKPREEGPLSAVPAGTATEPPTPRDPKEVTGDEGPVAL